MEHIAFEVPPERGQKRISAPKVTFPVPAIIEEIVTGVRRTPQEHDQERIAAQKVDIPVIWAGWFHVNGCNRPLPQVSEKTVERRG